MACVKTACGLPLLGAVPPGHHHWVQNIQTCSRQEETTERPEEIPQPVGCKCDSHMVSCDISVTVT